MWIDGPHQRAQPRIIAVDKVGGRELPQLLRELCYQRIDLRIDLTLRVIRGQIGFERCQEVDKRGRPEVRYGKQVDRRTTAEFGLKLEVVRTPERVVSAPAE